MAARVSDTTARTTRATGQGGGGYLLVLLLSTFVGLNPEQFGVLVAVVTVALAFLQNIAENRGWIPALMKKVPPRQEPVVDGPKPAKRTRKGTG